MQSASHSICSSCRLRLSFQLPIRPFSTSMSQRSIPPEAPNYIDVPPSHQPENILQRRPKGVLPVPRELFPANRPDKPSKEYIENVTQDKLPHNTVPVDQMSDLKKHKTRMTELRKQHLREGLQALYNRKQSMERQVTHRSDQKQDERDRLVSQAQREDERLTSVSTPQAMLPEHGSRLHTNDKEIYERKKINVEKQALAKAEERRNALHSLYMNARDFITTEEQLLASIEENFAEDKFANDWKTGAFDTQSIWRKGPPPTVAEMLDDATIRARKEYSLAGLSNANRKHEKDQQRLQRIAEELSGGKM